MVKSGIHEALLLAEKGDWEGCHAIVEQLNTESAAHIHAYLHRVEGDQWNAAYWYKKAQKPICKDDIKTELAQLIQLYRSH